MKRNVNNGLTAAILVALTAASIAVLLAGCVKKEAPAVPAENTAGAIPAPETPGTIVPPPAEPAEQPAPQAEAGRPESPPPAAAASQADTPVVPAVTPAEQPETPPPQNAAARAKQRLDRNEFDEAIAAYTEIIRLNPHDPGNADAYYSRGDAYYGKGDIDRATADWNEAIRLNPAVYGPRPGQNPAREASGAAEAAARGQAAAEKADQAAQSVPGYNRAQDALSRLQGAWE